MLHRRIEQVKEANSIIRKAERKAYVVGGALRDQLVENNNNKAVLNLDIAIDRDALSVSQYIAKRLKGAFVPLDEQAGSARVVLTDLELDINDFRAPTLEEDLALRDFTINAMAVSLDDWLRDPESPGPLIDPLNGRQALRDRFLIPCFEATFDQDPVRILRAYRFQVQLNCRIERKALAGMRGACEALAEVSGERVRDELFAILHTDHSHQAIRGLEQLGALDVLIPELTGGRGVDQGPFHHLDVLEHQIEALAQGDRLLKDFAEFSEPIRAVLPGYCSVELVSGRSRSALIKLAALLHDIGKPSKRQVNENGEIWFIGHEHTGADMVTPVLQRLSLANRETEMVRKLVRHHLRPGFLSREKELTRRAIYRFYRDLEEQGPACCLEWWCDRMATRGPDSRTDDIDSQRAFLEGLLGAYFFKAEEVVKPPRLLDGNALMQKLGLKPGKQVGRLLSAIEEAQAEGRIRTPEEALKLAKELTAEGIDEHRT